MGVPLARPKAGTTGRIGTVGFRRSSRRLGSTGTGSLRFLVWVKWWVVDLRLFRQTWFSLDLFLGSREIWSVWFGCFGLFNASNCPNCNVLSFEGPFFLFEKKRSHSQTWTKQGKFWIISAISHRHDKETSPWKWTYTYCTLLFSGTAKCCIVAWLSLFLWYVYNMSTTCLLYPYYTTIPAAIFVG